MNEKVAGYRTIAKMTQEQLASKLNISTVTYRKREKGQSSFTISEMKIITELVKEYIPEINIQTIFF